MMGRPSKLKPNRVERITDALSKGATRTAAAGTAGIDYETMRRWLRKGEQQTRGIYVDFCGAVARAEAEAEMFHTNIVYEAAKNGSPQNSQWWLERRRHEDWGKIERQEITGDLEHTQKIIVEYEKPEWITESDLNGSTPSNSSLLIPKRNGK
jgi:hypothetical protein